jgi:hypothetical protein
MRGWNTFVAQTNHGHTQTHKTHHDPNLKKPTTFPLILFFVIIHKAISKCQFFLDSQVRSPKFFEIGTPDILESHTFLCRTLIEVKSKTKL